MQVTLLHIPEQFPDSDSSADITNDLACLMRRAVECNRNVNTKSPEDRLVLDGTKRVITSAAELSAERPVAALLDFGKRLVDGAALNNLAGMKSIRRLVY